MNEIGAVAAEVAHRMGNVQQMLNSSSRLLRPDSGPDVLVAIADSLRAAADTLQAMAETADDRL